MKRRPVTLVELLLVLMVLTMVGGLVAINIRRAYQEQAFRAEVATVVDSLRLAQDLMLILDSDVHVYFAANPQGILSWVETEKRLTPNWERELKRKRTLLKAIHLVEMEQKEAILDVQFLSGGSVMSKGVLGLYSSSNKFQPGVFVSSICLPGIPQPIRSVSGELSPQSCFKEDQEELLTRDMLNEIQPRLQK